jgi:hypothetical protein
VSDDKANTTITIRVSTAKRLEKIKNRRPYDKLVNDLIDLWEKTHVDE